MRKTAAVLGSLLLVVVSVFAMLWGVLAFTPTHTCGSGSTTGVCAYGQLPMLLAVLGVPAVALASVLATWVRTKDQPRAVSPYIGLLLVVALMYTAATIVAA